MSDTSYSLGERPPAAAQAPSSPRAVCAPDKPLQLGILGGGQLGRMLALAAIPLGVHCRFLVASQREATQILGDCFYLNDAATEQAFSAGLSAITAEYEAVDAQLLLRLEHTTPVWPSASTLQRKRDRRAERALLAELNLPQPKWASTPGTRTHAADEPDEMQQLLQAAVRQVGLPCRVKTAFGGYDGQGQWAVRTQTDLQQIDTRAGPFVVEAEVPFDFEFSLLGAFSGCADATAVQAEAPAGQVCFWTPTINTHVRGILLRSETVQEQLPQPLRQEAERIARTLGQALHYRGVLAIEFFCVGGQLFINEFAPRVHNTGHWTIEGAQTSQFANHVRAVLGLPLGATTQRCQCISWNVLGQWPDKSALLRIPGLHVHDYGKSPRPGRKLGHVTLIDTSPDDPRVAQVEGLLVTSLQDGHL